jgi:hypothetical protein
MAPAMPRVEAARQRWSRRVAIWALPMNQPQSKGSA